MNAIVVKNLTKKYGTKIAVDDLSFRVEKGKVFGLLGANGARYILKVISTISAPTSTGIRA